MRDVVAHDSEVRVLVVFQIVGQLDGGQGLDMSKDGFELGLEDGDFLFGEIQAGELGDVADID